MIDRIKRWVRAWRRGRPGPQRVDEADLWVIPGARRPPADIVRRLHELNPAAVLVHLGETDWLLGTRTGTALGRRDAEQLIEQQFAIPVTLRSYRRIGLLRLHVRGLCSVAIYETTEPDDRIVQDYRARLWRFQHCAEATFEARLRESSEEPGLLAREATVRDAVHSELPFAFRYGRGRRHVS